MYKKIFITFLLIITISGKVFGDDETCTINDYSSKSLTKYIENNRLVIKNITIGITNSNIKKSKNTKEQVLRMYNKIINWDNYSSYFNYFVIFPISNDISYQVKRDYALIENELKGLTNYLDKIIKLGYDNIVIDNVCKGITTEECSLEGTSSEIVLNLIKNQSEIINLYRLIVMGKTINEFDSKKLQLVDNKIFVKEITDTYGYGKNCAASEGSFFATIMDKIKEIDLKNASYKSGVIVWKDSWELLMGNKTDREMQEKEEELLKYELARQGISGSKAEVVILNLKKFNSKDNGGYSLDNNFITNSFRYLGESIQREIKEFQNDVFDDFGKDKNTKTITIKNILEKTDENKLNESIAKSVSEIYNIELPFIAIGDTNTEMIRVDIIDMHNNLNKSINMLNNQTCENARKVCKSQDSGNGNCGTCN